MYSHDLRYCHSEQREESRVNPFELTCDRNESGFEK